MCLLHITFSFLEVYAIFTQQQGENTVVENGDKLGEASVLCPIWQWPIFQAGPYWKPFPYNRCCTIEEEETHSITQDFVTQ